MPQFVGGGTAQIAGNATIWHAAAARGSAVECPVTDLVEFLIGIPNHSGFQPITDRFRDRAKARYEKPKTPVRIQSSLLGDLVLLTAMMRLHHSGRVDCCADSWVVTGVSRGVSARWQGGRSVDERRLVLSIQSGGA